MAVEQRVVYRDTVTGDLFRIVRRLPKCALVQCVDGVPGSARRDEVYPVDFQRIEKLWVRHVPES